MKHISISHIEIDGMHNMHLKMKLLERNNYSLVNVITEKTNINFLNQEVNGLSLRARKAPFQA